jgi:hypothetical protein
VPCYGQRLQCQLKSVDSRILPPSVAATPTRRVPSRLGEVDLTRVKSSHKCDSTWLWSWCKSTPSHSSRLKSGMKWKLSQGPPLSIRTVLIFFLTECHIRDRCHGLVTAQLACVPIQFWILDKSRKI